MVTAGFNEVGGDGVGLEAEIHGDSTGKDRRGGRSKKETITSFAAGGNDLSGKAENI